LARPGRTRGLLAAATHAVVDARRRLVEDAGLRCALVDIEGLALLNAIQLLQEQAASDRPQALAVLNVEATHVTLAVAAPEGAPFVRDLAMPSPQAWVKDPSLGGGAKAVAFEPAIASVVRPPLEDVAKTIRFYMAQNPSLSLETVRVCGDLIRDKAFMDLVKGSLPTPTTVWNPMERMDCGSAAAGTGWVHEQGPSLAIAVGLGLRTA
jgi:type IV pilus assembly protein PilM